MSKVMVGCNEGNSKKGGKNSFQPTDMSQRSMSWLEQQKFSERDCSLHGLGIKGKHMSGGACQDLSLEGLDAPETGWMAKVHKLGLQMTKCRP